MGQHTSHDEQRRLVALWRQSNLSKAAFAREHRIRKATFLSWVARHPPELPARVEPPQFVQLSAEAPVATSACFPVRVGRHDLRFDAPPPVAWFAAVVRELSSC